VIPLAPYRNLELAFRHFKLEGFRVGTACCRKCGHQWNAVVRPDTVAWKLECERCHAMDNWFTSK
jgi:hypothetical protein